MASSLGFQFYPREQARFLRNCVLKRIGCRPFVIGGSGANQWEASKRSVYQWHRWGEKEHTDFASAICPCLCVFNPVSSLSEESSTGILTATFFFSERLSTTHISTEASIHSIEADTLVHGFAGVHRSLAFGYLGGFHPWRRPVIIVIAVWCPVKFMSCSVQENYLASGSLSNTAESSMNAVSDSWMQL